MSLKSDVNDLIRLDMNQVEELRFDKFIDFFFICDDVLKSILKILDFLLSLLIRSRDYFIQLLQLCHKGRLALIGLAVDPIQLSLDDGVLSHGLVGKVMV
jgi:hypothetical protein